MSLLVFLSAASRFLVVASHWTESYLFVKKAGNNLMGNLPIELGALSLLESLSLGTFECSDFFLLNVFSLRFDSND